MPSIKTLLMPAISQRLLSRERLLRQRAAAERRRQAAGQRHLVHYFHQVDDPYSALMASILPRWLARYDVQLQAHVVGPPADSAAPDRARLVAYSRRDAALLARHHGLDWRDPGAQPDTAAVARATGLLVAATQGPQFPDRAAQISAALWQGKPLEAGAMTPANEAAVAQHLAAAQRLRQQLGHYLGATLHYGGEWYWGIDRLHHLETRLQALGALRPQADAVPAFPPTPDWSAPVALAHPQPIEFFVSLRSPYSAIAAPRIYRIARHAGVPVQLRYVLPMVMRGLPVPAEKRRYISLDAAREAHLHGVPFGRLNDPLGRPTERGLALMPLARHQGCEEAYLLSFMRAVWAEGTDAGSDRGLRRIAERAGLDWGDCQAALRDNAWRAEAEANREALLAQGLWGVPSFRVGDQAVWGQDRLWAVQDALQAGRP
ncbi:MAG: DsbA family protein [Rhodoferax sp.]